MTDTKTTPPEGPKTIEQAMVAVMRDVDHLAKREKNKHYGFEFRGVDATLNALGPALRRHGVFMLPKIESRTYELVQTSKNKPSTACRVVVTFKFVAEDGSSVETTVPGEAWDEGDKGTAKAMSVAIRTALLQVFVLPTDEPDPDEDVYEQAQPVTAETLDVLVDRFTAYGVTEPEKQLDGISRLLKRQLGDLSEVTEPEAASLIEYLNGLIQKQAAEQAAAAEATMNDVEPRPGRDY